MPTDEDLAKVAQIAKEYRLSKLSLKKPNTKSSVISLHRYKVNGSIEYLHED